MEFRWQDLVWGGLAVLLLVAANGMFVAAEFAIVSVRRTRLIPLAERGSRTARLVLKAAGDPNAFLAATQLGITMASLGLGWIGEPAVARVLEPLVARLPWTIQSTTTHVVSVVVAFAIITVLHIVFGELAAKSAALWRPEGTALLVAPPTEVFHRIFRPFIWFLNSIANRTLGLFGLHAPSGHHVYSPEEISMLVAESRKAGVVQEEEARLVYRAFRFTDQVAEEVMVPRVAVEGVHQTATVADAVGVLREAGYTRLPVFAETVDRIVGMVHAKDLLQAVVAGQMETPVVGVMRHVLLVPERKPVVELLEEMRARKTHLAVVLDEYGGTAGIVTIEDLLEELVGEIPGEFRRERPLIVVQEPDRIIVDAIIPLEVLNEAFGSALPLEEANTLGGFIFRVLGAVPEAGQTFQHGNLEIRIQSVTRNRIDMVQIRRISA